MDNTGNNRLMLIINPISGTGSKKEVASAVESRMSALGYELDVRLTGGPMPPFSPGKQPVKDITE